MKNIILLIFSCIIFLIVGQGSAFSQNNVIDECLDNFYYINMDEISSLEQTGCIIERSIEFSEDPQIEGLVNFHVPNNFAASWSNIYKLFSKNYFFGGVKNIYDYDERLQRYSDVIIEYATFSEAPVNVIKDYQIKYIVDRFPNSDPILRDGMLDFAKSSVTSLQTIGDISNVLNVVDNYSSKVAELYEYTDASNIYNFPDSFGGFSNLSKQFGAVFSAVNIGQELSDVFAQSLLMHALNNEISLYRLYELKKYLNDSEIITDPAFNEAFLLAEEYLKNYQTEEYYKLYLEEIKESLPSLALESVSLAKFFIGSAVESSLKAKLVSYYSAKLGISSAKAATIAGPIVVKASLALFAVVGTAQALLWIDDSVNSGMRTVLASTIAYELQENSSDKSLIAYGVLLTSKHMFDTLKKDIDILFFNEDEEIIESRYERFTSKAVLWLNELLITEPNTSSLSNALVLPAIGNTNTSFEFNIDYSSTDNFSPNSINLNINGSNYEMSSSQTSYRTGAKYNYSTSFSEPGTYDYFFTTEVSGNNLRYPKSGFLQLEVGQSAEGWDLAVAGSSTINPSQPIEGSSIKVSADVKNQGIYTYDEATIEARLVNPSGTTIDTDSQILTNISPNSNVEQNLSLQMPNSGPDGTYKVIISARGTLDENIDNNVITKSFYIGELLGTQSYSSMEEYLDVMPVNNTNPSYWDDFAVTSFSINGDDFNVSGVDNDGIIFEGEDNVKEKILIDDIGHYPEKQIAIYVRSASADAVNQLGSINRLVADQTYVPSFATDNIFLSKGETATTIATLPSGYSYDDYKVSSEDGNANEIESWIRDIDQNSNELAITWNIPSNVKTGRSEIYLVLEYDNENPTFSNLYLNVRDPEPEITAISSTTLSADDVIFVTGTNFGNSEGTILFNDLNGDINSWTDTQISVTIPEGISDGNLLVKNANGTSNAKPYQVVSSTGDPIVLQSIPDQTMQAGGTLFVSELSNTFDDPNGDILTYDVNIEHTALTYDQERLENRELVLEANDNSFGTHNVSITATDADNASVDDVFAVTIEPKIIADFTVDADSGGVPFQVQFTDASSPSAVISSWKWDFNNDGIIDSEEENPQYTYQETGNYSVRLIAGDGVSNDSEIKVDAIEVVDGNLPDMALNTEELIEPIDYLGGSFKIYVQNTGFGTLDWSARSDVDWISIIKEITNEESGVGQALITVDPYQGCGSLTRSGKIIFNSENANNESIVVSLEQYGEEMYSEGPDLVSKSISGPPITRKGSQIDVKAVYRNSGDDTAPAGWIGKIYLSNNNQSFDGSEIELNSFVEESELCYEAADTEKTISVNIPDTISPGSYYLALHVDANDNVPEIEDLYPEFFDSDNNIVFGNEFQISDTTVISPPLQTVPQDDAVDVLVDSPFEWEPVEGADRYELHFNASNPTAMIVETFVDGTQYEHTEPLLAGRNYSWRVRAIQGETVGEWSPIWDFTTGIDTSEDTAIFTDDFNDGDFTSDPTWAAMPGSIVPASLFVENGEFGVIRSGAGGSGSCGAIETPVNLTITDSTTVNFDVKASYSSVADGSGFNNGEFPINVRLYLERGNGDDGILQLSYNYRGGSDRTSGNLIQRGFGDVTQGVWLRNQQFNVLDNYPDAVKITKIWIGGCGWDFEGYVDNLSISNAAENSNWTIKVNSAPEEGGTVEGAGSYNDGDQISLTAMPNPGFEFSYWSEDGVEVSSENPIIFAISEDRELTAHFDPKEGLVEYGNFAVSAGIVHSDSDWDAAVDSIFGTGYRVADWNDLVNYHSSGKDILGLFDNLGLTDYGNSVSVYRSGEKIYSQSSTLTRYYFATRHENDKPGNYLAHENIDNYTISLGSWEGDRFLLAYKETSPIQYVGNIEHLEIRAGDDMFKRSDTWRYEDISNLFNGGSAPISYSHETSNSEWVEPSIEENVLQIAAKRGNIEGEAATISISATGSDGETATGTFNVTVSPAFGDVNADTRVNSFDASQVLRNAVELIDFNAIQDDLADLNRDSRVNSFDASLILRYAVELIDEIPINSGTSSALVMASAQSTGVSGSDPTSRQLIWGAPDQQETKISIPISIEGTGSVYSIDFSGSYDASLGVVSDIVFSDLPDGWVAIDRIDEDEGRIYIAMAGSRPFEGDQIASLEFELLNLYESLPLSGNGTINTTGFSMDELSVREIPDEFALNRNYPNPFNPSTTISYQLPANSDVRLEVYNITGQRVLTLVDKAMDAGMHTHRFDMSAYSSGVYFIRMQATSEVAAFQDVNKMTLIK
ncbi:InlB B-repeat-containing protein [Rhodohalobacter sp. 8-1]|uniref:InlB B-repeat-containing protein n=1 Tax=Rhodohalobacter sp. 8-1 TaxID=3131972 RepID=UPI0030EE0F46